MIWFSTLDPRAWLNLGAGTGLIVLLLSYAVGFALHRLTSLLEALWWNALHGGMPTDWVLGEQDLSKKGWTPRGSGDLLTEEQRSRLREQIPAVLSIEPPEDDGFPESDRGAIRRQVYSYVENHHRTDRIDRMNGNYRMAMGLLMANLILSLVYIWSLWSGRFGPSLGVSAILVIFIVTSLWAMHRSGVNYAEELFTQFLTVSEGETTQ